VEKIKTKQKQVFKELIKLANEVKKPVIIHCWDAYDDLYEILQHYPVLAGGVVTVLSVVTKRRKNSLPWV
jgi:Tat protein secretion system quality control protein TatD with DNase activity